MDDGAALILVKQDVDVVLARQRGRELAAQAGFTGSNLTLIATAISEIARNIVVYAGQGELVISLAQDHERRGIKVVGSDQGPGIPDIKLAMQDGYSTGRSLGLGLPGARRLMDDFEIFSEPGVGTTITMWKWLPS